MKIMHCPLNGPRNIDEFVWMGDVSYLFIEDNLAGEVDEWWIHAPSNNWFIARRNRITDEILWTRSPADYFSERKS